jgi:hypothetical protein
LFLQRDIYLHRRLHVGNVSCRNVNSMVWGVVVSSVSWAARYFPAYFVFWATLFGHWHIPRMRYWKLLRRNGWFVTAFLWRLCPKAILVRVTLGVIKVLQWHWIWLKQGDERVIGSLHKKSSEATDSAPPWPQLEQNRRIVWSGFVLQGLWFLSISSFMWTTYSDHALVRCH